MPVYTHAVREKAIRYIQEGRIRPEVVGAPIESFLAFSDSSDARYRVCVGPSWSMCMCPATSTCCHRIGGELLSVLRRNDPVAYGDIAVRIADFAARDQRPIDVEEIVPS